MYHILTLLFIVIALSHHCIHEDMQSDHVKVKTVDQNYRNQFVKRDVQEIGKRSYDESRYDQALRIFFDYSNLDDDDAYSCYAVDDAFTYKDTPSESGVCTSDMIIDDEKRDILTDLVEMAIEYFEHTLAIIGIDSLDVANSPSDATNCNELVMDSTYDVPLVGYNFVVFLTARPIFSEDTTAYATYCQQDAMGRPTVGHINFNPIKLSSDKLEQQTQFGVIMHELTHSLGFSTSKFSNEGFIQWSGDVWSELPPSSIWNSFTNGEGNSAKRIVTPEVLTAARDHFNCDQLAGVELENRGSTTLANGHWEKRVFQNEYMTATESTYPIISEITFSLLKDTGWYGVANSSLFEILVWGRGRGCSFVEDSCDDWSSSEVDIGYKCSSSSEKLSCTFDFRSIGQCNYQAPSETSDNCNFYVEQDISGRCDNPDQDETSLNIDTGEIRSAASRCFSSNLLHIDENLEFATSELTNLDEPRCYKTKCLDSTNLKVSINDIWYDCPINGATIDPIGYGGRVFCPEYMAFTVCEGSPTDDNWPTIESFSPKKGAPGSQILITGTNFVTGMGVDLRAECEVKSVSSTQIVAVLPDSSAWSTLNALFSNVESLVIRDPQGRTAHVVDAFTVQIDFFTTVGNIFKYNTPWAIGSIAAIIALIGLIILCCCCCCCDNNNK